LILRLREMANPGIELPTAARLQQILPDDAVNQSGRRVTFVASRDLPGVQYEQQIFRTGEISTRENNWHDLFNALVWARFPCLKSAMNALHCQQMRRQTGTLRGRLRDALTLLDECGVIVASANREALDRLAAHDWQWLFRDHPSIWRHGLRIFVCGHALLEKFLKPYKSLTAHALLLQLPLCAGEKHSERLCRVLDLRLAKRLLADDLFDSPSGLSAVPLMGIPGWWPHARQDAAFYADYRVFRRPAAGFRAAPVFEFHDTADHQAMP